MDSDATPAVDPARAAVRVRDARLVAAVRAGDESAFGQLYDAWFDRVFDLAQRVVHDPDTAAEIAQDAFLSAWRGLPGLEQPESFGGWLLRIARNAAYNRSRREQRSRPVDEQELAVIEHAGSGAANAPDGFRVEDRLARAESPDVATEDAEVAALVWEAAEALGERDREVLDLQLRHGLTPAEIGEVVGMNRNAANQLVHRLRGRLQSAVQARVLWRDGQPACAVLGERLRAAGIEHFGAEAVRVAERHVPGCEQCEQRRRLRLQPTVLFGATPLLFVPVLYKQQAAAALAGAGDPVATMAMPAVPSPAAPAAAPHDEAVAGPVARRGRAVLMGLAALVVLVLVGFGIVVVGGDDEAVETAGPPTSVPADATSVTTPSTSVRSSTASSSDTAPPQTALDDTAPSSSAVEPTVTTPSTDSPPVVDEPTTDTTASQPPAPPTVELVLSPSEANPRYLVRAATVPVPPPTLTWSVVGDPAVAAAVEITGASGGGAGVVLSTAEAGALVVCPGTVDSAGWCISAAGSYDYTITVYDEQGGVSHTQSATLTIVQAIR
jgi:RNA polymerase sigma factor (sigma-70 family)